MEIKKNDFHCDPYRNEEEVRKQRNKKMEGRVFSIEEEKYGNKEIWKRINILLNFKVCSFLIVTYRVAEHVHGEYVFN